MDRAVTVRTDQYGLIESRIKELQIGQQLWRYSVSGAGKKYLLALMANVAGHVFALPLAEAMRSGYTVIALSVPPLPAFGPSGAGLREVLENEKVTCCDAIGHSNGGVHIQNLISLAPAMVDRIIFSHSLTAMTTDDLRLVNDTEAALYRKARLVMKVLPVSVLLRALGGQYAGKLKLAGGAKDTEQMRKCCRAELQRLTRADLLLTIRCMEDFLHNYTFQKDYYERKADKILLLNSPTDKMVNPRQKESMRRLCPGAAEYQFTGGGHTPMVACPEEYYRVVKEFLKIT